MPGRRLGDPTFVTQPPSTPDSDVFLSHASEDKDEIARPLKEALEARGLTVWFDEIRIKVGQSIRREIEKGITHARFGVVILSPDFFAKQWTQAELDALFSKKMASGGNLILQIWHRVNRESRVDAYAWLLQHGDEEQLFTHVDGALLVDAWPDIAPRLAADLRRHWQPLVLAAGMGWLDAERARVRDGRAIPASRGARERAIQRLAALGLTADEIRRVLRR